MKNECDVIIIDANNEKTEFKRKWERESSLEMTEEDLNNIWERLRPPTQGFGETSVGRK